MILTLNLNAKQEEQLDAMCGTGLYGSSHTEAALRILDHAFLDFASMPPIERREPWEGGE